MSNLLLDKGFYQLKSVEDLSNGKYVFTIELDPEHPIFLGHFPNNPVTPGACMVQIVKELVQHTLGAKIRMVSASNVKFTALINPFENPILRLETDILVGDEIRVKNSTYFDDTLALKMNHVYQKVG